MPVWEWIQPRGKEGSRERRWNRAPIIWALDPEVRKTVGTGSALQCLVLSDRCSRCQVEPIPFCRIHEFFWVVPTSIDLSSSWSQIILVCDIKLERHFLFLRPCFFSMQASCFSATYKPVLPHRSKLLLDQDGECSGACPRTLSWPPSWFRFTSLLRPPSHLNSC